jgi:hypothetical protein
MPEKQAWLLTAGGQIRCRRCQGMSRRTGVQCGAPAEQHSEKCRFHGCRATGPITLEGLERCALAKWQGKGGTRAQRALDRQAMQLVKACGEVLAELQAHQ